MTNSPLVLFDGVDIVAANKPAGLNTHAPGPYAGEGLYEWLRDREPHWADLAIIHRLDKETSGVMVFSKTARGSRSLTEQFTRRTVRKKYLLLTDRAVPRGEFLIKTALVRAGERYVSRPHHPGAPLAETRFRRLDQTATGPDSKQYALVEAEPLTGRTHQIRVHAAERGFPVLGDILYRGSPAARVCLHAAELTLQDPATGRPLVFEAPVDFAAEPRFALRAALLDPELTNAFRLLHGVSDGWPGWYVERLGEYLLSQSEQPRTEAHRGALDHYVSLFACRGAYHKTLSRQVRRASRAEACPRLALGQAAPERFTVRENGVQFELSFREGYSVGLFLDQRDNRRRLLSGHVASGLTLPRGRSSEVLNTFAYTCAFSVCAAKAGARTTSIDLSRKYLDWGRRNFMLNGIDPGAHDFIFGDVFDWMRRLAKRKRRFEVILLDPPTFAQSKQSGVFRAAKDYGRLVAAALPLLAAGGVLFASSNAADWKPGMFMAALEDAVRAAGRRIAQQHYVPQPPDLPVSRGEPAYLKTVWLRVT